MSAASQSAFFLPAVDPNPIELRVVLGDQRLPAALPGNWTATTKVCVAYLLARNNGDLNAEIEAWQRLVCIMLTATAGLYLPERGHSPNDDSAKFLFIEEFLSKELKPYLGKSRAEIEAAADADKFRYLGHKCRCRVLNAIRDIQRASQSARIETYNDEWDAHQPVRTAPPLSRDAFDAILSGCDFLSPQDIEVATALFDLAITRELPRGRWAAELAVQRGISIQMARRYIRDLRSQCKAALKNGHIAAKELFDRLAMHIVPAQYISRDLRFSSLPSGSIHCVNPATGEPIQFDRDGYFAGNPGTAEQDPQREDRAVDWAALTLSGEDFSWKAN